MWLKLKLLTVFGTPVVKFSRNCNKTNLNCPLNSLCCQGCTTQIFKSGLK